MAERNSDQLSIHQYSLQQDLSKLLNHVIESDMLILCQTSEVIARPWMILEVHTALTNNVPIVALYLR